MIGICIHNLGSQIAAERRTQFYSDETAFELTVGTAYEVLGLGIWETLLVALVRDDTGKPNWVPVGAFEIGPCEVPSDWRFCLHDGAAASGGAATQRWAARWGYPELATSDDHVRGLIERDPAELAIFAREFERASARGRQVQDSSNAG